MPSLDNSALIAAARSRSNGLARKRWARHLACWTCVGAVACGGSMALGHTNPAAQYRGVVSVGPESVTFTPCRGSTGAGKTWWLDSKPERDKLSEVLAAQPRCDLHTMPCKHQRAYAEVNAAVVESADTRPNDTDGIMPRIEVFYASSQVPAACR